MPKKVKPIRPRDLVKGKKRTLPNAVLSSFNELITQEWNGSSATIKQDDVVALMVKKGLDREEIFDKGWLDGKAGWSVKYDKPGYNESYDPNFTFERRH